MNPTFRRCVVLGILAGSLAAPAYLFQGARARAETPAAATDLPAGKDLIEKYIETTGGRENYKKFTNRRITGTITIPAVNAKGPMTVLQVAPDKGLIKVEFVGLETVTQGSDGETVWEVRDSSGARILDGKEREQLLRQLMVTAEIDWTNFYKSAETVGVEQIEGKPAYKVKLLSKTDDSVLYEYFDQVTGLLVRLDTPAVASPMGPIDLVTKVANYQEFDGIMFPTVSTQEMSGMQIVSTIESVEHNKPVDPSTFDLPADIKKLKAQAAATQPAGK